MKNIFENAYFGKAYRTRDGRKATYLRRNELSNHILSLGFKEVVIDWESGKELNGIPGDSPFDIISEWQEEINEVEFNGLAKDYIKDKRELQMRIASYNGFIAGYRVGYKKAKEEAK